MASDFREFLTFTSSQKEVSLVLAKDETVQNDLVQILYQQGFHQIHTVSELLKIIAAPTKVFYLVQNELPVDIYEFIQQYPTRHISIYDKATKKFVASRPIYKDVAVILVVTKDNLEKIHSQNFTLFDKVGLTYQE